MGNPLQCSCLENPRDRGAWWAAIYGVAQSRTRLKQLSSSSSSSRESREVDLSPPHSPSLQSPPKAHHWPNSTQSWKLIDVSIYLGQTAERWRVEHGPEQREDIWGILPLFDFTLQLQTDFLSLHPTETTFAKFIIWELSNLLDASETSMLLSAQLTTSSFLKLFSLVFWATTFCFLSGLFSKTFAGSNPLSCGKCWCPSLFHPQLSSSWFLLPHICWLFSRSLVHLALPSALNSIYSSCQPSIATWMSHRLSNSICPQMSSLSTRSSKSTPPPLFYGIYLYHH